MEKNKWSYKYVQAFQDYMPKKGSSFNGGEYKRTTCDNNQFDGHTR